MHASMLVSSSLLGVSCRREHLAQGGACRSLSTFPEPLLEARVDELLAHLGILLQQDLDDVLPPRFDLGILDRAEPPEQLVTRRHRHLGLRLCALRPHARAALLAADKERVGRRDLDEGYRRSADAAADVHGAAFSMGVEDLDDLCHLWRSLEDSLRDLIDGHQYLPVLRICLTSAIISLTSSTVIDH